MEVRGCCNNRVSPGQKWAHERNKGERIRWQASKLYQRRSKANHTVSAIPVRSWLPRRPHSFRFSAALVAILTKSGDRKCVSVDILFPGLRSNWASEPTTWRLIWNILCKYYACQGNYNVLAFLKFVDDLIPFYKQTLCPSTRPWTLASLASSWLFPRSHYIICIARLPYFLYSCLLSRFPSS